MLLSSRDNSHDHLILTLKYNFQSGKSRLFLPFSKDGWQQRLRAPRFGLYKNL